MRIGDVDLTEMGYNLYLRDYVFYKLNIVRYDDEVDVGRIVTIYTTHFGDLPFRTFDRYVDRAVDILFTNRTKINPLHGNVLRLAANMLIGDAVAHVLDQRGDDESKRIATLVRKYCSNHTMIHCIDGYTEIPSEEKFMMDIVREVLDEYYIYHNDKEL